MKKRSTNKYTQAKTKFTDYLEEKKMRKTTERFEILKCVCNMKGRFDIDTIFIKMKDDKFRVSRSTLYSTLNLLVDCGIVAKYLFTSENTLYEYIKPGSGAQYHIVVQDTDKVIEFKDDRIDKIVKELELQYNLNIHKCQFIMYANNKKDNYGK